MDSILDTIKKMLGIDKEDVSFDTDIMVILNSSILSLSQIGVGPANGFVITSAADNWTDYITGTINLEGAKTYLYLKSKLIFDPPTNSNIIEAIDNTMSELEWRMMLAIETNNLEVT